MCFHLLEASSTDHDNMLTDYIGHGIALTIIMS